MDAECLRDICGQKVCKLLNVNFDLFSPVTPQWFQARQRNTQERTNPSLYVARYFGHKLHIDQNEKLVHYGVTYVLARDGFSGKLVSGAVMARKNNKVIYYD